MFNNLENKLEIEDFKVVFPSILTDRDPCFSNIQGIEFAPSTGKDRTKLFFCDASSNQKANVENINKELRKFFPRKTSIDHLTEEEAKRVNLIMINLNFIL